MCTSGGSRRRSDRGSTLQFWLWWVWWAWLAWKLDLCNDVVKENPMISIFRKLESLKPDRGSSPLRPPLDPPLCTARNLYLLPLSLLGHWSSGPSSWHSRNAKFKALNPTVWTFCMLFNNNNEARNFLDIRS